MMLGNFDRGRSIPLSQVEELINRIYKKNEVKEDKKYTWLIILVSAVVVIGAGFAIYKYFFEPIEDYDEFDEFDDFDEDDDFEDDEDDYEELEDYLEEEDNYEE